MLKITNVLIVENEELLTDVLKNAFLCLDNTNSHFNLKITTNCSNALKEINKSKSIDLALLNININAYETDKILFIEDVSYKLRLTFPKVKIILFSSFKNNIQINFILETLNPDCLLIKSDINYNELIKAIETVIIQPPYYSKTVLRYIRRRLAHNIIIDKTDRSILQYLSIGTKMKELPGLVHLSKSAIESRKRNLKLLFNVEKKSDHFLLEQARMKGFV